MKKSLEGINNWMKKIFQNSNEKDNLLLLLRITCFLLFAGRAWQHLFWDAPFRTLLWDEDLLRGLVEGLTNVSWNDYVTNPRTDVIIQGVIRGFGVFYLSMAILCLVINKKMKRISFTLWLSSFFLVFLAFLYCKEKFFHVGQFFEYTIQFMLPIFLYQYIFRYADDKSRRKSVLVTEMKIAIALTFICHGLYAVGFYPTPGNFIDMTINIFPFTEKMAFIFLHIMGLFDFIVAIVIFFPSIAKPALLWAFLWGTCTALARVLANVDFDFFWVSLHQWLPDALYRLPHGLIPLILYIGLKQRSWHEFPPTSMFHKLKKNRA